MGMPSFPNSSCSCLLPVEGVVRRTTLKLLVMPSVRCLNGFVLDVSGLLGLPRDMLHVYRAIHRAIHPGIQRCVDVATHKPMRHKCANLSLAAACRPHAHARHCKALPSGSHRGQRKPSACYCWLRVHEATAKQYYSTLDRHQTIILSRRPLETSPRTKPRPRPSWPS